MKRSACFASAVVLAALAGPLLLPACGGDDETEPPTDTALDKCPRGFLDCGDKCVAPDSDDHCGACDVRCPVEQACRAGACVCLAGEELCGARCVDLETDDDNCGACGEECPAGAYCGSGSCHFGCTTCGENRCIDLDADPEHCGSCGIRCAEGDVCTNGQCAGECAAGQILCDDRCADTTRDPHHCGDCETSCGEGAMYLCADGTCIDQCYNVVGQARCDDACVDTLFDRQNCGECGIVCGDDQECINGACKEPCATDTGATWYYCNGWCVPADEHNCGGCGESCPFQNWCTVSDGVATCYDQCDYFAPGTELCADGQCHDFATDAEHCGDCDTMCADAETCVDGECTCLAENTCDGVCTDLEGDPGHCGDCDTACAPGESCLDGECGCPDDGELCGDECVDLDADEENCGACDFPCDPGQACIDGVCECPGDYTSCSGVCRNLQDDEANCGFCNNVCPATLSCVNGTCRQELTCEQNFTEPLGCDVFPVQADACGTPALVESTPWGGADISSTLFFDPATPWQRDELIRISGETDAPEACCGGGVVSLGFQTSEDRTQTWTQFVSPNDGISHATPNIEEMGSAFDCSQPEHAFFGATGNFDLVVERFAMSGDFNGGGTTLAEAAPLAVDGDGEVCAQVCGVHKAQCANEQRQYFAATIPPHRALAIDYGAKGNGTVEALEVYAPTGEFVCNAVGAITAPPGYVFYGSRIANHTDEPKEVVLAPVGIFASSFFNIAVGLEDAPVP